MKQAVSAFGPLSVASSRLLIGAALLVMPFLLGKKWTRIAPADLLPICALSLLGVALPFSLQPFLIRATGNSGFIGMMVAFVPVFTILVSIPMLGRRPTGKEILGVSGGLGCLFIIFYDGLAKSITPLNLLLAAITPMAYAINNTYARRRLASCPPAGFTILTFLFAGLALLPVALANESARPEADKMGAVSALMLLGLISTGLAGYAFFLLLVRRGPLYAGMVGYTIPAVAVILGWFHGEPVSVLQAAALAAVVLLVGMVQREQRPSP